MSEPSAPRSLSDERRRQMACAALFPALIPPPAVGRFRIEASLGAGAMGTVYRAHDDLLGRPVAIKVLRSLHDERATTRLLREARGLAQLNHPNVVTVFEVGEVDGQPFIAMEYVPGQTLRTWCDTQPAAAILAAYHAAGRGLAAVHAAGLVHRDFKPANVLLGADGQARVADFGLVRSPDSTLDGPRPVGVPPARWTDTTTGAVLGTPAYMAPEQLAGQPATAASDQFAFCVALYEALTGTPPAEARDGVAIPRRGLSRGVHRALVRGLSLNPAERWPDMPALLAALDRRDRRRWLTGGAALIAAIAGGVLLIQPEPPPPRAELMDADPAHAAAILAEAPADADWPALAWQALHTPFTATQQSPPFQPTTLLGSSPAGRVFAVGADDAIAIQHADGWRPVALMKGGIGGLFTDAAPAALQADLLAALDWTSAPRVPVGETAIIARQGGWLLRWRAERLEPLTPFPWRHTLAARQNARLLAFNPDEPVWSVPLDGRAPAPIPDSAGARCGAASADHDALALPDGRILLAPIDGPTRILDTLPEPPTSLRFSPDGRWLMSLGAQVRVWDLRGRTVFDPAGTWRPTGAFSVDSRRVVLARADHAIVDFALRTRHARVARGHTATVRHLAATPAGWVSAGDDGTVRRWRMTAAEPLVDLPGIWSAHTDGQRVATAGRGGVVGVFALDGSGQRWRHPRGNAYQAVVSPDGAAVLSGAGDGTARIWPLAGGDPVELPGHAGWAYAVAFSPDGAQVATADKHGGVRLWSRAGVLQRAWHAPRRDETRRVHHVVFTQDGAALAWAHRQGPVRLAPLDGSARVIAPGHAVVKRAASGHLFTYGPRPSVDWFSPTGKRRAQIPLDAPANAVIAADDRLAIFTTDRQMHLREPTKTPTGLARSVKLRGTVEFAAFSPDAARLAIGYPDGVIEIMQVTTGALSPLGAHAGPIRAVLWPQPDVVITGSLDGQLLRWRVDRHPDALRARLVTATAGLPALPRQAPDASQAAQRDPQ